MFCCQITRQRQNIKKITKKEPPPAPSIAPMSPAVIIFYFCILFIAFYMERKLICHFCLIYFVLLSSAPPFREHVFFSVLLWPFIFFFLNAVVSVKTRDLILVSFVVLEQTPTLKRKKRSLFPFSRSLLEQWWTSQMISGYCLVLVPYLSSTFPKHGLYIHDYPNIHSPQRAGRSAACCEHFFDAAARSSQQTLHVCIFLMGLF